MAVAHHLAGLLGGSFSIRGRRDGSSVAMDMPATAFPVPALGKDELDGFAVIIVSEDPASTEWFATRVRGLGAITILLGQPYHLNAVLQTASERVNRIVVFVDGRETAALPLLETLRTEPASRGVPLELLHRSGG